MDHLISVIIPMYNSMQYIGDCIESVLAQSYTCWELLLIDDGSYDNTKDFCNNICREDSRIRLFCQKHKGVSAARNKGIQEARGKYLFFLDSDDVIHPELLGTLYRLQEKYQTSISTESRYYASGGAFQKPACWNLPVKESGRTIYLDSEKAVRSLLWGDLEATLYVIGGKMIRRSALNHVRFDENLSHGEDTVFLYQLLAGGADVMVFPYDWYYYRKHESSVSRVYSIRTIRSRYKAEEYIRSCEIQSNRMDHAIHWEEVMVSLLVKWYAESRKYGDKSLRKYVRSLAGSERKLDIFQQIRKGWKQRFYIVFYCYPLYRMLHILELFLFLLYKKIEKKKQRSER